MGGELGEAHAVGVDEGPVDRAPFDEAPVDPLEQGEVGTDGDGEMEVGQGGGSRRVTAEPLRVAEGDQAGLRQRVDRHDRRAIALGLFQRPEHARMVGTRVLPGDDDQLGGMHVVECDGALADADRLAEGDPARLVAHVRAVRQIVRAEGAGEQLVQEGGLVARPPGRVEDGAVRRGERSEPVGDDGNGTIPRDRPVVRGAS